VAETLQQLLRERLDQDTPALKFGDQVWTWCEHLAEAAATVRRPTPGGGMVWTRDAKSRVYRDT